MLSQPSSSASSIAASDKSLTSFPSFSPELAGRGNDVDDEQRLKTATQESQNTRSRAVSGRSIVDSLTGQNTPRDALFEDAPLRQTIPGALHRADDAHIKRLVSRHGAVSLVRQIAEDLAQRDSQISALRRRANERERALKRIIRECGLSNLDLETRLKVVEAEQRDAERDQGSDEGVLSDLMSDAMQDTLAEHAYSETQRRKPSARLAGMPGGANGDGAKGTLRGWKDYILGSGTSKKPSRATSVVGDTPDPATVVRSHSSMDRRPTLQDDLFNPPNKDTSQSVRSASRASSVHSAMESERKSSVSLASMALRYVAGGTGTPREVEPRGRAATTSVRAVSTRAGSSASGHTGKSARAASNAGNPKALMAMRRASQNPLATGQAPPANSAKTQAQDMWGTMVGTPPSIATVRQESYGPVEMDAILPPESQPPTLSHIYGNNSTGEFLTDRFGFIYDQRRKKRQREAAKGTAGKVGRTEMLTNGRTRISPNLLDDLPSPKWSVSSDGRPGSPASLDERVVDEGKPKRWQDYLKIATFPTELLSHTPSVSASALEVLEGTSSGNLTPPESLEADQPKGPSIVSTEAGLMPQASTTTAVDSEPTQTTESEATSRTGNIAKEDEEPVKLLLKQLSEVHDSLQRDKTVKWNDFLRKVRAERRKDGEAAAAAAAAVAESRYEAPAMNVPEAQVADGEMIGITGLGNKGKVGRAKWNEFKTLLLGGIPVSFRGKVWSECSGANGLRVPGYYDDLVAQDGKDDDAAVVSQIRMDIHRTLTDNIFFRKGPGVQKLNQVLLAYSRRNKDVGYCQGMNLIAANLLLITPSAEDAFWILASFIETILPHGYYDQSLMASRADQQVLRQYVSTVLPKLSAHLDLLSIELEALTFQWFLSVFTDCLCAEALFRVWDVVLCTNDGSTFLFQVALALLKLNEGNLLQCDTPAGVYTYINHHMTEHAISIDGLVQASEALRRVVRREDVEQWRNKAIQAEKDMLAERDEARKKRNSVAESAESRLAAEEPRPIEG